MSTEQTKGSADQYLMVFFRKRLTLCIRDGDPGLAFTVGDTPFRSKIDSDMTGFYDRLRDRDGHLIGFQVQLLLAEEYLPTVLSDYSYVTVTPGSTSIRIFFDDSSKRDVQRIDDQAFGGRVYESISGSFAISMNTYWLTADDLAAVRRSSADWLRC
jgi:hypothetical protein